MSQGFVITKGAPVAWWPVEIEVPADPEKKSGEKAGQIKRHAIELKFKACRTSEFQEVSSTAMLFEAIESGKATKTVEDFLVEHTQDWRFVKDEKGKALKFDADLYRAQLDWGFWKRGVMRAYANFIQGVKPKN